MYFSVRAPGIIIRARYRSPQPKWRNWQTRQVQDLVPVMGVEVRVLSSAPFRPRAYDDRVVSPSCLAEPFSANLAVLSSTLLSLMVPPFPTLPEERRNSLRSVHAHLVEMT